MLVSSRKKQQKVAGAGIWWTERGEASKHPSILNRYGSELNTLILTSKSPSKKQKSLKTAQGIGRLL